MARKSRNLAVRRAATGLGLFTLDVIPGGERIIQYRGPILTEDEAEEVGGKYLFELDENRVIDGSSRHNLARYINHSCRPNAYERVARGRIWIWSSRPIRAEEEITLDYGDEYFDQYIKPKGCKCEACTSPGQTPGNG
jgi:uncharacterized protein